MKKIRLFICAFFITVVLQNSYGQATVDSADQMKAYMDFMTPGEHHKRLAKEVGTWKATITHWVDPNAPATKTTGTNVVTMAMNGLYQVGNFSCTMMGMPMTGQSTVAYDNAKKMYILTWIDNFGSGILVMTGNYDVATKTLSVKGQQTNPLSGKDETIRQETKYIDDDNYTTTMYGMIDGKETVMMKSDFKRKK